MNAKPVFAAVATALIGISAFAVEATQFVDSPSALSRAQVNSALLDVRSGAVIVSSGEATQFVDVPVAPGRTRDEVRAEAKAAPSHSGMKECPYVGG